jgi:hypothetical protein
MDYRVPPLGLPGVDVAVGALEDLASTLAAAGAQPVFDTARSRSAAAINPPLRQQGPWIAARGG